MTKYLPETRRAEDGNALECNYSTRARRLRKAPMADGRPGGLFERPRGR
ncbi:hypothetical protein ACYCAX_12830 [Pseudomonas sp. MT3]|nr:hypothetical protein [Pseudomonas sp. ATCC 13867]